VKNGRFGPKNGHFGLKNAKFGPEFGFREDRSLESPELRKKRKKNAFILGKWVFLHVFTCFYMENGCFYMFLHGKWAFWLKNAIF
jgi:hypothetical protein